MKKRLIAYKPGPADGLMGKGTRKAIESFQSKNSMFQDGDISERLIQRLRKRNEEVSYIKKVELRNFKVGEGERFGKKVPGIFGTIVNNGDESLREVEITVYFLNAEKKAIGEKNYFPVLKTEYESESKLLKPNYIKEFGFSVED